MKFAQPFFLLALLLIPIHWRIRSAASTPVGPRQRRFGLLLRSTLIACIVLALSGASLQLPENRIATVFVVDYSDSVGSSSRDRAVEFIRLAVEAKPEDALAGIVVFGREARVESTVSSGLDVGQIGSRPDPSRSDLSRAIRLASALLPEGTRRRIVLLSDGRENSGNVREEATRLRREKIRLDSVRVDASLGTDAAVVSATAPARVRIGDEFEVEASIVSNTPMSGSLSLRKGGRHVESREVTIREGENKFSFTVRAESPGSATYSIDLEATKDTVSQNDSGSVLVLVDGPPRVQVIEGAPDEGARLADALAARGFVVERRNPGSFPSVQELAALDAVVLVDVEASALTDAQVASLGGFVRDLGKGLVAVGGEQSWSLGGYRNTSLEDLLPLESDIKDPKRRPSMAQVLAIDTSGSMAQCHCAGPGMESDRLATGPNKTDISRSAAGKAIEALTREDEVGVLAFNTTSRWVIPLQRLPSEEVVRNGLARLTPTGGTSLPQALHSSVAELKKSKASLRHIILFTDGWTNQEGLEAVASSIRQEGITISVVATGEGTGDVLARVAEAGGGRFYAGRNLDEIPEIFMNEVILASRRYVNEGVFYPKITGASAATEGLSTSPPLRGYISTSAKPSASVSMALGEFEDPLLASWRTGLGIATAWTSDAKDRWAAEWIGWTEFADFWSRVVRETLAADPDPRFSSRAISSEAGLDVIVESEDPLPEGVEGRIRFVAPDGSSGSTTMTREGASSVKGTIAASGAGAYLISVDVTAGEASLYRDTLGAVRSYSAEYLPGAADTTLLAEIAEETGGREGISPADAFDPDLPRGSRHIEIWPSLVLAALLLLPLDIAVRRLVLTREDLKDLLSWRPRRPPTATTPQTADALLERKRDRQRSSS